jgi:hypothetical protein
MSYNKVSMITNIMDLEDDNRQQQQPFNDDTEMNNPNSMMLIERDNNDRSDMQERMRNKYIRKGKATGYFPPYEEPERLYENAPFQSRQQQIESDDDSLYQYPLQLPTVAPPQYKAPPRKITCLEICDHITKCPICSNLYNSDRTIYIIMIIILCIIIIICLKKILNV